MTLMNYIRKNIYGYEKPNLIIDNQINKCYSEHKEIDCE